MVRLNLKGMARLTRRKMTMKKCTNLKQLKSLEKVIAPTPYA